MAANDTRVDVCLENVDHDTVPYCPHGPTLLFERLRAVTGERQRRFYACSACRDRRECSFFQWEGATVSESTRRAREQLSRGQQPKYSHAQLYQRKETFMCLCAEDQLLCEPCGLLLLPADVAGHRDVGHAVRRVDAGDGDFHHPTLLLQPLDNNKTNAQYLFSEQAVQFTVSTIQTLGFSRVLCVGAPRLHEALCKPAHEGGSPPIRSLLMDIDYRLGQFFPTSGYCRYNMFNHHFFEGESAEKTYRNFIKGGKVVVVTDPPFGGLVAVLAHTLKKIDRQWNEEREKKGKPGGCLPVLWFFPYFMERRITEHLPEFHMLDYKVDYTNHPSFKSKKSSGNKHGSPVRIFTNMKPSLIPLPADEGYRYCGACERWVAMENTHCEVCDACTSKDGRTYIHCEECQRCVKPSYKHCGTCRQCLLPTHTCGQAEGQGCYICGDASHKKRECPQRTKDSKPTKRKNEDGHKSGKKEKWKHGKKRKI